jgi:membrane-bound lytic murein transglycosylase D
VSYVEHAVARGQTLGGIARLYRVNSRLIVDANPGVRVNRLRPGMRLVIPTSFVPPVVEPADAPRAARPVTGHGSTTVRYRVRSGESLWIIAGKYNTTVEKLRALNAMSRSESLRAGQVIRVPAVVDTVADPGPAPRAVAQAGSARTHLVRRGETLSSIAARYRVGISELRSANGLAAGSVLKAGTRLVVPD